MNFNVKHFLVLLFALFSITATAQKNKAVQDSIEYYFYKTYENKKRAQNHAALEDLVKILVLSDSIEDKKSEVKAYLIRAELIISQDNQLINFNDIYNLLDRTEKIQKSIEDNIGLGHNHILKALAKTKEGEFSTAISYFDKAESIFIKDESLELINKLKYYKGLYYLEKGENEKAIEHLENSLPIPDKYESNFLRARVLVKLGKAYQNIKHPDAKLNAENALKIANVYNFPEIKLESYRILSKMNKNAGNIAEALAFEEAYSQLNESIHNMAKTALEAQAHARFDSELKAKQIKDLELESDIKDQRGKRTKLTSILSSALLIIISLLTISLYRNNQIKVKTNNLLLKKNSELQLAKDNAEKAMKTKAQFLSTVTHELRTPLYAVTGLTHLLLEENPSESQKEHLKSLKFSGDYLLTFINDILQVNKIEAKKLAVEKTSLNLRKILKDVVTSLTQTSKENLNAIILDLDSNIPNKLIGDPLKISQIFINLISNGLKFTKEGNVTVSAKITSETDTTQTIKFEVNDDGIGISEEMQKNIFDSFSQGSVQINRKYGGTGLGLTIVKSLLELLGSRIELKSKLGEGSTFFFSLTFDKVSQEETVEVPLVVEDPTIELKKKKLKVLLVEDNKINQVITKKIIAKQNMTCDIANDGYEAVSFSKNNIYDIILMDIHMPGISGIEATKQIRKFDTITPIIALTAISLDDNKNDFLSNGFNEVISKPFDPDVFYQKISTILS